MKQTSSGTFVLGDRWADYAWLDDLLRDTLAVGLDVETKTLKVDAKQPDPQRDALVGIGLALNDYEFARGTYMIPVYGLATDGYLRVLRTKLHHPWYAHNAMFDATVLKRYGVDLGRHAGDPRIVAYMLGELEAGLKPLLQKWLGFETLEYHEILEQWDAADISQVPIEAQADYCALQDAAQCVILEQTMRASLSDRVMAVYTKVELPMVNILVGMTHHGIKFDREAAAPILATENEGRDVMDALIDSEITRTGFQQWEMKAGSPDGYYYRRCEECKGGKKAKLTCERCWGCGKEFPRRVTFNPASTDQLRLWLYDFMGAPVRRYAGGYKPWQAKELAEHDQRIGASTDSLALLQLKGFHPAVPLILSRRKFAKRAQFLAKWMEYSKEDGRLHPMFSNTRVATGRLSSYNPNAQQITLDLRRLFIAG